MLCSEIQWNATQHNATLGNDSNTKLVSTIICSLNINSSFIIKNEICNK